MDEMILNINSFINEHEFFWLTDLKAHLGLKPESGKDCVGENFKMIRAVNYNIQKLLADGTLQCCEKKGTRRQYFRTKLIY